MQLVKTGKTKDVFKLADGTYLLKFKDNATGEDGKFDPGANQVGLVIDGMGNKSLSMSKYFFEKIELSSIKTHYISADLTENTMLVKPCIQFGEGLELICRFHATGSFIKRYGMYAKDGEALDSLIEFTLKDDERNDPLANEDILIELKILSEGEYQVLKEKCKEVSKIIQKDLNEKGLELYDIKLEFAKHENEIILIDEISAGNMRVYKKSEILDPLVLSEYYA